MSKLLYTFVIISIFCTSNTWAEEQSFSSHLELGLTTSLTIHPSIGYWWGRTGLRFSGMYWNKDTQEYHINLGYVLWDKERNQHSINLLTSWVVGSDPGADYRFASSGIAYGINYKGLFFELGLAIPWHDELGNLENDPIVPCGYWGYIHRFK